MLNFDRSTVKRAVQNTQNDCHQWLSHSFRVHQIRFRPGLRPGPRWGSLQRSRRFPSWFKGNHTSKGRGGRERGRPLTRIPGSAPDIASATHINTCMVPWVRVSLPPKRHLDRFIRFCRVHPFVLHTYHGMFDIESNNHTYAMRAIRIILRQRHFTVFNNYHCWPL